MKKLNKIISATLLTAVTFPAIADIIMGVFPRRPISVTHKAFTPLAKELEKQLGEKVKLVIAKNFKAFWKGVKNKQYDLVHYNQYHYLLSTKLGYKVILANVEFGNKVIAGSLSVRKDSGIKSVADLKGKTILFGGGKKAMGSYIAPTAILKKAGLEAGKDYTVKFAKNPPGAVIGVFNKAAAASGSGNVILKIKGVKKKIDTSQMMVLAESDAFVHLPWAVKGNMSEDKAKKIQSIMTSLSSSPTGKKILKSAKVTDYQIVTDADFAKVKEITKFAIGQDL